jgi:hypothetical protein
MHVPDGGREGQIVSGNHGGECPRATDTGGFDR